MTKKQFFEKTVFLETIESTNSFLKTNPFPNRTIAYTFNQTKGKGRNQKNWTDFKDKNIALSYLLKSNPSFNNITWFIATCSLSLINILKKLKIKNFWIKWPNDIYINENKLAGILAESIWKSGKIEKIIIGIGININCTENDLKKLDNKATSILIESGSNQNLNIFFNNFKDELSFWLDLLINKKNINKIRKTWLQYCKILNKKVEWLNGNTKETGIIKDINKNGSLIIRINNKKEIINSGEVKIIK